jgi:hypothetical protein
MLRITSRQATVAVRHALAYLKRTPILELLWFLIYMIAPTTEKARGMASDR